MSDTGFQGYNASDRSYSVPAGISGIADTDLSTDPAGHTFLSTDSRRHGDLKEMLDGNKDSLKLEAMKRIVTMVARGRDASDLFPSVVKNVVTKDPEIKKLVYVYLARYAEEQQDLALLSISSFQRALKDPNPLIRANSLRVLCGIRVSMVIPIMMLALKEAVNDMSPYVRKTAANAIPKLLSLDPELREQLIDIIQKLLGDRTTLVVGSAIVAFEEVCPDRIDLIHKNYRKLCNMVVDVDEWGQVVIINMLARYARSQFVDPNQGETSDEVKPDGEPFYASSSSDEEGNPKPESERRKIAKKKPFYMDPDHRLLLRNTRPLLQSRNAAVVMAVAQLYYHCAPLNEVAVVARSLVRLLRGHREIQYIVLSNIAAMSLHRHNLFEPHLKSFFIRSSDPSYVKLLKLEILTSLANETNVSGLLREFQTYVSGPDKDFAAATIQAIGRCAANISTVTDTCLAGLVNLMSKKNEAVVAESVVVIRKLLQLRPSQCQDIITQMARLVERIAVPMARASILWLIGEYSQHVPKIAPDVLRIMAKNFVNEEDSVKLQIINLAAKLITVNPKQTRLLAQYVFNLAKYDQSYDIRDRARMLRCMVMPTPSTVQPATNGDGEEAGKPVVNTFSKNAKKILLATKPAPILESKLKEMNKYRLGTLSQLIASPAEGYAELPEWPPVAPDPTVRNVEIPNSESSASVPGSRASSKKSKVKAPAKPKKEKAFYSDEENGEEDEEEVEEEEEDEEESGEGEEEEESVEGEEDDAEEESGEGEEEDEEDEEENDEDEASEEEEKPANKPAPIATNNGTAKKSAPPPRKVESEESEEESEEEEEEEDDEEEESEEEAPPPPPPSKKAAAKQAASKSAPAKKAQQDFLLDLDFGDAPPAAAPVISTATLTASSSGQNLAAQASLGPVYPPPTNRAPRRFEVIDRVSGGGLVASYTYPRTVSVFQPRMVTVQMNFVNTSTEPLSKIRVVEQRLQSGQSIQDFGTVDTLSPGATGAVSVLMSVDFKDSLQTVHLVLGAGLDKTWPISITPTVGELLQPPASMNSSQFTSQKKQLAGMNETSANVPLSKSKSDKDLCYAVYEVANVVQVPSTEEGQLWFAGHTSSDRSIVLITLIRSGDSAVKLVINCEKLVVGNMLLKELQTAISS